VLDSVDVGGVPVLGVKGSDIHFSKAVALEITFIHYPQAKFISEVVQTRVIDLVRGADSVDVVGFHEKQIVFEKFVRHRSTVIWVMLVAVDSPELDWLPVHQEDPFLQLSISESNSLLNCAIRC